MNELLELMERLQNERPVDWDSFPDINLYKDQVVVYLKRQLINSDEEGHITPAMISNYVKDKLIPKADGKKYNREHLALLTEISLLKQVLAVKDISFLLNEKNNRKEIKEFYDGFIEKLDKGLSDVTGSLKTDASRDEIIDMALNFAIESYCAKLVCESLISIIRD